MTTFKVSEKASNDLSKQKYNVAKSTIDHISKFTNKQYEAASCNTPSIIENQYCNGFLQAIHSAYANHYPLILSPDDIWTAICIAFSTHVSLHAEELREHFVAHEGKLLLNSDNAYTKGSPDNDWTLTFDDFSKQIRDHIGDNHKLLVSNFSTTGVMEKAVSELTLMNTVRHYFDYRCTTCCGIPSITLLGTTEDWTSIKDRVEKLSKFNLEWWTVGLSRVMDQFILASQGNADVKFWDNILKISGGSGGPFISGWINVFFPYLRGDRINKFSFGNDLSYRTGSTTSNIGVSFGHNTTDSFPSGLCNTPFVWNYYGQLFDYEFVSGFVGVYQDPETLALRPSLGFTVREVK